VGYLYTERICVSSELNMVEGENFAELGMVTSCNVKGLMDEKLQHFRQQLQGSNLTFMQEVHGTSLKSKNRIERLGFMGGNFSFHTPGSRGAAVLWRGNLKQVGELMSDEEGRVAGVALQIGEKGPKFAAVSAYAPTLSGSKADQKAYLNFLMSLEVVLDNLKLYTRTEHAIVGGDFNLILSKDLDSLSEKPRIHSIPREALLELTFRLGLSDTFRVFNPTQKASTYEQNIGRDPVSGKMKKTFNRLDFLFVSDAILESVVSCAHRHMGRTDHQLVEATFVQAGLEKDWKGLWRHNDLINVEPDFVEQMQRAIEQAVATASRDGLEARGKWEYVKAKARELSREFSIKRMKLEREEKRGLLMAISEAEPTSEQATELKERLEEILRLEGERWIFRAKMRWVEENEKSTKFFFMRVKSNRDKSNILGLETEEGIEVTEKSEVSEAIADYFQRLYSSGAHAVTDDWLENVPQLDDKSRDVLSRPLTCEELEKALFAMQQGKSPGNDGLTVGFYRTFWKHLKGPCWEAMQEGLARGELAPSQKQTVIRLILKKGKNPKHLKGWRPISLMNNDAKMLSGALAARLKPNLPLVTSCEQAAFVEGKVIQEGTRLIDQVIRALERRGDKGGVLAVDFSKAFDSVEHDYLWAVMSRMNLGSNFIHMIRTLYNGSTSSVMNAGATTRSFVLERSCRQGCPISPGLFLLAIEPLLLRLKVQLNGVVTPGGAAKLAAFADDLTVFIGRDDNLGEVLNTITLFAGASGLKINLDKSELLSFGLGANTAGIPEVDWMQITGIVVGKKAHAKRIEKLNFQPALDKIEAKLNLWRIRHLTIAGRVLAVKAHALSQIQYLANSIPVPPWCVKELNRLIYRFLWKGPDKITRVKASKAWKDGGIGMPIVADMCAAAALHWFRRVQSCPERLWAKNLALSFLPLGGMNAASYDLDVKRAAKELVLEPFTLYLLNAWASLANKPPKDITPNTPVWLNNLIKSKRVGRRPPKTLLSLSLCKLGFLTVADFVDSDGRLVQGREAIAGGLSTNLQTQWMSVVRALAPILRKTPGIKGRGFSIKGEPQPEPPVLLIGDTTLDGVSLTQKKALLALASAREYSFSNQQKTIAEAIGASEEEWSEALRAVKNHSSDMRRRDRLFRVYSGTLYTNKSYHRFGYKESPKCSFCPESPQSLLHLLCLCPEVGSFRDRIAIRWTEGEPMTTKRWLLGSEYSNKTENAKNFIARELLLYIHSANWANEPLSVSAFKGILRASQKIEYSIADKNNRLEPHLIKWEAITPLLA